MITHKGGSVVYSVPRGLDREKSALVEYVAAAYGFLLNAPGRRFVAHTWAEFSALIRDSFAQSPPRDAVISVLASV